MAGSTMIPERERPRNRLRETGEGSLGVADLIMLVTGSETTETQMRVLNSGMSLSEIVKWDIPTLRDKLGFTVLEATKLRGAFDLGRRAVLAMAEARVKIKTPADAAHLLRVVIGAPEQEELWVCLLNTRNEVMSTRRVAIGTVNEISIRIADVLKTAVREGAVSMIVCHNHPSGDPTPGAEDIRTTGRLIEVCDLVEIPLFDHIVLGDGRFVSIRETHRHMWTNKEAQGV